MNRMIKIAITTRFMKQDFGGGYYYINNANVKMFNDNGIILVPITCEMEKDFILENSDGLFVPGGCDVDPKTYHEKLNGAKDCFDFIDDLDIFYITAFHKAHKPILGICRGIQIINVCFGGSLYQDIAHHENVRHEIIINKDSFLYDIYQKEQIEVNSYHHQIIKELGKGLRKVATSKEGYIEAIEGDRIYAVQWHPEIDDDKAFIKYFKEHIF